MPPWADLFLNVEVSIYNSFSFRLQFVWQVWQEKENLWGTGKVKVNSVFSSIFIGFNLWTLPSKVWWFILKYFSCDRNPNDSWSDLYLSMTSFYLLSLSVMFFVHLEFWGVTASFYNVTGVKTWSCRHSSWCYIHRKMTSALGCSRSESLKLGPNFCVVLIHDLREKSFLNFSVFTFIHLAPEC